MCSAGLWGRVQKHHFSCLGLIHNCIPCLSRFGVITRRSNLPDKRYSMPLDWGVYCKRRTDSFFAKPVNNAQIFLFDLSCHELFHNWFTKFLFLGEDYLLGIPKQTTVSNAIKRQGDARYITDTHFCHLPLLSYAMYRFAQMQYMMQKSPVIVSRGHPARRIAMEASFTTSRQYHTMSSLCKILGAYPQCPIALFSSDPP